MILASLANCCFHLEEKDLVTIREFSLPVKTHSLHDYKARMESISLMQIKRLVSIVVYSLRIEIFVVCNKLKKVWVIYLIFIYRIMKIVNSQAFLIILCQKVVCQVYIYSSIRSS